MPWSPASGVFALGLTGDLGGVTFVQRAGLRRTSYAKTYPKRKPSGTQLLFRKRFKEAVQEWQQLSKENKFTLDEICRQYRMVMSGYNLFISCRMNQRMEWVAEWAQELNLEWSYNA